MLREMILKPQGIIELKIEEFEKPVYIRRMTAAERAEFLKHAVNFENNNVNVEYSKIFENMARLVAIALCDKDGKRVFSDSEEDIQELQNCDAVILEKMYNEASKANGLGENSIKEAAKNS